MKLLVLGGTAFVGRAVVAQALERGYDVTAFNRGRTGPPPPGVEALHGDRTRPADLDVLAGRSWDVVVDTWAGAPRHAGATARLLAGAVGHYGYVSSVSVYRWPLRIGATEADPVVEARPDADTTEYAADKRGAELAILEEYGDALLARAGLILGPHEDIGRLPWWLRRVATGGEVLAPGPPDLALQYVDARDLAAWMLDCSERRTTGPFNVVSAPGHTTTSAFLAACRTATDGDADLVWVDADFVLAQGIEPWTELPVWVPPHGELLGMHRADTSAALAAGLRCRPVAETVTDTWHWLRELSRSPLREGRPAPGLDPVKERSALDAWRAATDER